MVSWWGLFEAMDPLALERSWGDEGFTDGGLEVAAGGVAVADGRLPAGGAGQRGVGNHCAHAIRGGERPGEHGASIVQQRAHGGAVPLKAGDLLLLAVSRVLQSGFLRFQDPDPIPDFLQGFLSLSGCSGWGGDPLTWTIGGRRKQGCGGQGGAVGMSKFHGGEF